MTTDLLKIQKSEQNIFEILLIMPMVFLYALVFYFVYSEISGLIILELVLSPLILAGIFNVVLKRKTAFQNTKKNPKIFFDVLGNEKIIPRYDNVLHYRKKAFQVFLISIVLFGVFLVMVEYLFDYSEESIDKKNQDKLFVIGMMLVPGVVAYGFHVVKNGFTFNLNFDYLYSKSCFTVLTNNVIADTFQLKLSIMGLKSYNNYLKFQIGREITKFDKIILTVLGDSKENMSCTIHEIDQKLQSDDRLELLRYLTTKIGIERIDFVETRDIDKIKEWGPIILPPIAIVVGLLSIFWK